jgi:hypothetical protein
MMLIISRIEKTHVVRIYNLPREKDLDSPSWNTQGLPGLCSSFATVVRVNSTDVLFSIVYSFV